MTGCRGDNQSLLMSYQPAVITGSWDDWLTVLTEARKMHWTLSKEFEREPKNYLHRYISQP